MPTELFRSTTSWNQPGGHGYFSYGSTKKDAAIDAIYATPIMNRTTVNSKIMPDGSFESIALEMKPSQMTNGQRLQAPNAPKEYFKRITKGSTIQVFDQTGKSIGSRTASMLNLKPVLDEIKRAKANSEGDALKAANDVVGFGASMIVSMAKAKNGQVKKRGEHLQEVSLEISEPGERGMDEYKMHYVVDMQKNTLITGTLVDKQKGSILSQTAYFYKTNDKTGEKVISKIYTENFYTDAKTNRKEKTIVVDDYKYFEFIDNTK